MTVISRSVLLAAACSACFASAAVQAQSDQPVSNSAIERRYCTAVGPVHLRFDDGKVAGFYDLVPYALIGSVYGSIENRQMEGEWTDDNKGFIRMTFTPDFGEFDAATSDPNDAATWYEGWIGRLQPESAPATIEHNGDTLICQ